MALENANINNISSLNVAWPLAGDLIKEGDDHLRLLKSVLKKQFPGLNKPVTVTSDELNNLKNVFTPIANGVELNAGKTMRIDGALTIKGGMSIQLGANIDYGNNIVHNVSTPVSEFDAANKRYIDDEISKIVVPDKVAAAVLADRAVLLRNVRKIAGHDFDGGSDVVITATDVGAVAVGEKVDAAKEADHAIDATNATLAARATTADSALRLVNAHTINGVAFDGTSDITLPVVANPNADTATRLQTPRKIAGHVFDGSQDVVITPADIGAITATDKAASAATADEASHALTADTATNANTASSANTAVKLTTARSINGVPFDGTADINIPTVSEFTTNVIIGESLAYQSYDSTGTAYTLIKGDSTDNHVVVGTNTGTTRIISKGAPIWIDENGVEHTMTAQVADYITPTTNGGTGKNFATWDALVASLNIPDISSGVPSANHADTADTATKADTADALTTAHTINGVAFDGTSDITIFAPDVVDKPDAANKIDLNNYHSGVIECLGDALTNAPTAITATSFISVDGHALNNGTVELLFQKVTDYTGSKIYTRYQTAANTWSVWKAVTA